MSASAASPAASDAKQALPTASPIRAERWLLLGLVVGLCLWWMALPQPFHLPNNDYYSFERTARSLADLSLPASFKRMPIFRYLNYKELVRVMNITEVHDFDAEETIIEEGSPAQDMFIILEGKVRLHKDDSFITNLEPGDHFGEMAMVDSAPRSASASAAERARLLVMRRSDFYDIIRDESQLSVKLLWSFVQVLAQRLRKTTADLSGARLEASLPDFTDDVLFDDN